MATDCTYEPFDIRGLSTFSLHDVLQAKWYKLFDIGEQKFGSTKLIGQRETE